LGWIEYTKNGVVCQEWLCLFSKQNYGLPTRNLHTILKSILEDYRKKYVKETTFAVISSPPNTWVVASMVFFLSDSFYYSCLFHPDQHQKCKLKFTSVCPLFAEDQHRIVTMAGS